MPVIYHRFSLLFGAYVETYLGLCSLPIGNLHLLDAYPAYLWGYNRSNAKIHVYLIFVQIVVVSQEIVKQLALRALFLSRSVVKGCKTHNKVEEYGDVGC